MLVNDAPLDVAMTGEKLKNMENIPRDKQKLMKEYNTLRQYEIQLKSLKETGNIKKERAVKRKLDEEDQEEDALAGPSIPNQSIQQ